MRTCSTGRSTTSPRRISNRVVRTRTVGGLRATRPVLPRPEWSTVKIVHSHRRKSIWRSCSSLSRQCNRKDRRANLSRSTVHVLQFSIRNAPASQGAYRPRWIPSRVGPAGLGRIVGGPVHDLTVVAISSRPFGPDICQTLRTGRALIEYPAP